jgi:hypothetical protein
MKKLKMFSLYKPVSSGTTLGVKHHECYHILTNEPLSYYRQCHLIAKLQWLDGLKASDKFLPILPKPFMAILIIDINV